MAWPHGKDAEATKALERAVNLKPSDPVLNDHLGDAYWRVNRRTEAHFQWNHARDMGPEPDDLPAILHKIEHGLPDLSAAPKASDESARRESGG